ncbi:MAG: acyl carrier protein [Oleiphilaceae bacterium]|nr:acyl carrier protein [Oleiphilaceae bacterium]
MNRQEIRAAVIEELVNVAPDIDPAAVEDEKSLRDEYDLDSMDSVNLVIAIHRRLGVSIPDSEFGRLQSVEDVVNYLQTHGCGE